MPCRAAVSRIVFALSVLMLCGLGSCVQTDTEPRPSPRPTPTPEPEPQPAPRPVTGRTLESVKALNLVGKGSADVTTLLGNPSLVVPSPKPQWLYALDNPTGAYAVLLLDSGGTVLRVDFW